MAVESYLRVLVNEGEDPIEVQGRLSSIAGYIGSYLVDVESLDGGFDPFDLIIGFNGRTAQDVDDAVRQVADQVADVKEFRNRNQVQQLIGSPGGGQPQP